MPGRIANTAEAQFLVGIDIEHHPLGPLQIVDRTAPDVELERTHLHPGQQPRDLLDIHVVLGLAVVLDDGDGLEALREALGRMLLVEMVPVDAIRRPDDRQQPAPQVLQHPVRHCRIIGGQPRLGDAGLGIDDAVGAGELHPEGRGGLDPHLVRQLHAAHPIASTPPAPVIGRSFHDPGSDNVAWGWHVPYIRDKPQT